MRAYERPHSQDAYERLFGPTMVMMMRPPTILNGRGMLAHGLAMHLRMFWMFDHNLCSLCIYLDFGWNIALSLSLSHSKIKCPNSSVLHRHRHRKGIYFDISATSSALKKFFATNRHFFSGKPGSIILFCFILIKKCLVWIFILLNRKETIVWPNKFRADLFVVNWLNKCIFFSFHE